MCLRQCLFVVVVGVPFIVLTSLALDLSVLLLPPLLLQVAWVPVRPSLLRCPSLDRGSSRLCPAPRLLRTSCWFLLVGPTLPWRFPRVWTPCLPPVATRILLPLVPTLLLGATSPCRSRLVAAESSRVRGRPVTLVLSRRLPRHLSRSPRRFLHPYIVLGWIRGQIAPFFGSVLLCGSLPVTSWRSSWAKVCPYTGARTPSMWSSLG